MDYGNLERILFIEAPQNFFSYGGAGKSPIIGSNLFTIRDHARINENLVVRIKIPQKITADDIVVKYRPFQTVFLQERYFFTGMKLSRPAPNHLLSVLYLKVK